MTRYTTIRHLVKAGLVRELRDHTALTGTQIEYGWPGDTLEMDSIYVAGVDGPEAVPTSKAGRWQRDDTFTITMLIQTSGHGETIEDTEERGARYLAALEDTLAQPLDDTNLDIEGLLSIGEELRINGPTSYITQAGAATFYAVEIDAHARYQ